MRGLFEEAEQVREEMRQLKDQEEALRREALEEARAEMRAVAALVATQEEAASKKTGKASKKKKRRAKINKGARDGEAPSGPPGRQQPSDVVVQHEPALVEKGLPAVQADTSSNPDPVGARGGASLDEECAVCFLPLADDDQDEDEAPDVCMLPCDHLFHNACLDSWISKCAEKNIEPSCPMCRAVILRS